MTSSNLDRIPMRELERLSGFPRATILFYVKEGLLPPPHKTAKNMARYDRRFVDGLALIRELRDKHGLSLSQIKAVLQRKTGGVGVELLLDLRDRMFQQVSHHPSQAPLTLAAVCEQTRLRPEQVTLLATANLLFEVEPGAYHPDSVAAGRVLQQLLTLGFPLNTLVLLSAEVSETAQHEIQAFIEHVSAPMLRASQEAAVISETVQTGLSLLTSIFSLAHVHALRRTLQTTDWGQHLAAQARDQPNTDE